jgi:hypothetical protein
VTTRGARARAEALLGPPGSQLRRWRLALLGALALLLAWLVGPLAAWRLPGDPTLVPGPGQSRIHTVLVALWWAAAANASLLALLLATSARWARPLPAPFGAPPPRARRAGLAFLALLLAAVALGGALRFPLAQRSLWWDEAWSVRKVIVGEHRPSREDPERLAWKPASWLETLWYYRAPTNHALYSVAARASLGAWRSATGAPREAFDELALRLPAWLAALASIALVGLLARELGFARAAPAAALLLALHPWHVRFGADGRGYAFVVLFTLAGAFFLLRALRGGRWRDWLGFGASQGLLLWTFPLAVHVPLAQGGAGLLAILLRRSEHPARGIELGRLGVASALAAMVYFQAMAPNLAQGVRLEDLHEGPAGVPERWTRHLWVLLATGLPARMPKLADVSFPTLAALSVERPWLPAVVFGLLPALALLGVARVALRGGAAERAVVLGLAAPVPLFLLHRELEGFFLLHRFAAFGLAAVPLLLALGLDGALGALPARARRVAAPTGLALGVLAFAALAAPQLRVLARNPIEPSREIVSFLAQVGGGRHGGVLRAGLGLGGDVPRVYDPRIREVHRPAELAALCAEARAEDRPLYVFHGYGPLNQKRLPELMALARDARLFEPVARFDGIESEQVYRVLRYTGAPLDAE